jgi:hypothetical protein
VAGYAARARIERASPQFVGLGSAAGGPAQAAVTLGPRWVAVAGSEAEVIERAGIPSLAARLGRRLSDLHETWAQATFFLFDPESWR